MAITGTYQLSIIFLFLKGWLILFYSFTLDELSARCASSFLFVWSNWVPIKIVSGCLTQIYEHEVVRYDVGSPVHLSWVIRDADVDDALYIFRQDLTMIVEYKFRQITYVTPGYNPISQNSDHVYGFKIDRVTREHAGVYAAIQKHRSINVTKVLFVRG